MSWLDANMFPMKQTPTQLLMETRLGEPLAPYVLKLRADERTWRYIAKHLAEKTGHAVTPEALRLWFGAAERAA
jgi:hypothetical protein